MCSRDMDRWIHFNMAIVGGFLGGFSILNHHELFGSAQTSNLISVFADLAGHPDANFFVRLLGVFIYMFALSLTVILPKFTRLHLPYVSLFIDAMAALIVAFLPSDLNDFIALYPLYFAMAIQWCSFKGGDGFTCSTIFSTNNLRQFTTSMTEYLCSKDPDALRKWKFFASVLLCFHFGVIVSYLFWTYWFSCMFSACFQWFLSCVGEKTFCCSETFCLPLSDHTKEKFSLYYRK